MHCQDRLIINYRIQKRDGGIKLPIQSDGSIPMVARAWAAKSIV